MSETQMPSKGGLLSRVLIAMVAAAVILTAFVLPAEYNIDPTGIGKAMGLTQLAKAGSSSNSGGSPEGIPVLPLAPAEQTHFFETPPHTDEIKIKLKADGELEYKVRMRASDVIIYSWTADGKVYYDFHNQTEPKDGSEPTSLRYKEVQEATSAHGSLTAPFDGIHGWYWLNLEAHPVTITLKVTGFYSLRPASEQPTETE